MTFTKWNLMFAETSLKDLKKLQIQERQRIVHYLEDRICTKDNPRELGKATKGDLSGLWRYRVGDYRIIADILDKDIVIQVVRIGHRKNIYT